MRRFLIKTVSIALAFILAVWPIKASVRFASASSQYLIYDPTAPSGDFTIMCWFLAVTDTAGYAAVSGIGDDAGTGTASIVLFDNQTAADVLEVWTNALRITGATTLSINTWYHVAIVGNTGASQNLTLYLNGVSDGTGDTGVFTYVGERVVIATDVASLPSSLLNGRVAAFKFYTAQLTQAEIQNEIWQYRPQRTANLWQWAPLLNANEFIDFSGNARNFSDVNTPTTEDSPPISW